MEISMTSPNTEELLRQAKEALKLYFGYDEFRPLQTEIIENVLNGNDTIVLMPTGGGKSMCFQIPAIIQEGICIVVSPLIALMKDQVEGLRANGVKAAFLNSSLDGPSQFEIERDALAGEIDILYVSPEKLLTPGFTATMTRLNINLFAIDEAHCISSWGHDFRPEYTQMSFLKKEYPNIPIIALTATADKATRGDISKQLGVQAETFLASFDRPNLSLTVLPGQNRYKSILKFVKEHSGQSGIIYALSRKSCEQIAAKLMKDGINADFYHAGLSSEQRNKTQENFINDKTDIICATVAFGMGIDKSNIRWVIHYNLPKNIESYYQEIGRAGRDGLPSETLLFYSFQDVRVYRDMFSDSPTKSVKLDKLDRMLHYAESLNCRRKILLSYFSETLIEDCNNCDVCENPPEAFDGTIIAQKALSCVARLRETESMSMVMDVLRGSGKKEVIVKNYHNVKTYGVGRDISYIDWQQYLMQLVNLGLLEIAYHEKSALKLNDESWRVLKGGAKVELASLVSVKQKIEERLEKSKKRAQSTGDALLDKLKEIRKSLAMANGLPAYLIFSDATLKEMAATKPVSESEMREISGVGEYKLETYGADFLGAINQYMSTTKAGKELSGGTHRITMKMYKEGFDLEDIARQRKLKASTILSHLIKMSQEGEKIDWGQFITDFEIDQVRNAYKELKQPEYVKEIFEFLEGSLSYEKIRLAKHLLKLK